MTQDGGFFFKKRKIKTKKSAQQPTTQTPLCPSPPTSASVFAPFAHRFSSTSGAAQGDSNPSGSSRPACSQMSSGQPACSTATGVGRDRTARVGVKGQVENCSWEKHRKGSGVRCLNLFALPIPRAGCVFGWLPRLGTASEDQACGAPSHFPL